MSPDRSSSDPEFMAAYGNAVQRLRRERNMQRKELAVISGISYSYLSAIESGQKVPSGSIQDQLADALGVSAHELLATANDEMGMTSLGRSTLLMSSADDASPVRASREWPSWLDSGEDPRETPTTLMSPSGALEELRALMRGMSPEDAAMVVSLARRLASSNPQSSSMRSVQRRTLARPSSSGQRESRMEAYLRVWTMYLDELDQRGLDWAHGRRPEPRSYFTTRSPIKGTSMSASFARNHKIRHEMYINRGSRSANMELLDELREHRDLILEVYGADLDFEDPGQERRAVRLAEYRDGHYSRHSEFGEYVDWFIDRGVRLRRAIDAFLEVSPFA